MLYLKNAERIVETFRRECHYIAGDEFAVSRPPYQPLWGSTCPHLSQVYIHRVNGHSSMMQCL